MRHLSQCTRLPLAQCTEQEFEEDLYTFLTHRGEVELANDLRNKRINWCAHPPTPQKQYSCGCSGGLCMSGFATNDLCYGRINWGARPRALKRRCSYGPS